jgi:hypothetical protein
LDGGAGEFAVRAAAGGLGLSGEEFDGLFSAGDFGGGECGVDDFVLGGGEMEEVGRDKKILIAEVAKEIPQRSLREAWVIDFGAGSRLDFWRRCFRSLLFQIFVMTFGMRVFAAR